VVSQHSEERELQILVVDDSTSYRRLLSRHLQNWGGYKVVEAEDGTQALEMIISKNISMVISDWEMPGLNGPELCQAIRDAALSHYVYFILVTSRGSTEDLIIGMEAGADDFLTKPIDQQELRVRLRAGERILKLEEQLEEKNQRLNEAYKLIEADLKAAADMQQSLLPQGDIHIDNIDCKWFFQPSLFVSGDMHSYFKLDHDHMGFYSVDVAGHGVKPAMLSVTLSRFLSHGSSNGLLKKIDSTGTSYIITPPSVVVSELNAQFQMTRQDSTYFTIVYGVLNIRTGKGQMTRAGHPHPIIVHENGQMVVMTDGGLPVGFIENPEYENSEFELLTGSRLYLYTDGITECENKDEQLFGEDRLLHLLHDRRYMALEPALNVLQADLLAWRDPKKTDFNDDISMLAIGFN
jgi:sigma-B regulation protein RsbU (phosphoserine phosphatase)